MKQIQTFVLISVWEDHLKASLSQVTTIYVQTNRVKNHYEVECM